MFIILCTILYFNFLNRETINQYKNLIVNVSRHLEFLLRLIRVKLISGTAKCEIVFKRNVAVMKILFKCDIYIENDVLHD